MQPHSGRQLRELFQGALDQAAEVRYSWLAAQCADEPEMLRAVLELLAADAHAGQTAQPVEFAFKLLFDAAPQALRIWCNALGHCWQIGDACRVPNIR